MAGTSYFNAGTASNGDSPFYKLKPLPLINRTNIQRLSNYESVAFTNLPVWRSGAANNYFKFGSGQVELFSVNAAGTASLVGTSIFNSYLASSDQVAAFLSSTDQCIYILLYEAPQYRLIKVSDTLGTTTTIGSAFTPTTASRWPTLWTQDTATMWDDGTGSLKLYCRGYTHQINKTTGATVSQNVVVTVGSYSLVNTSYLSLSGSIASSVLQDGGISGTASSILKIPCIVSASAGILVDSRLSSERISEKVTDATFRSLLLIDNDKVFIGNVEGGGGGGENVFGYILRSDFDQFLQSVVDWQVGN